MTESAHYQKLEKFAHLFQELESLLIDVKSVIAKGNAAVELLPAEIAYPRLVESIDVSFSHFVDLLRRPVLEAKTRFHQLMQRCLEVGALRNRLYHSTYALLEGPGDIVAPGHEQAKLKLTGGSRRQATGEDLLAESFEPYFRKIVEVLTELDSFRLQVIEWKNTDA
jgi:hypothetical protein